MEKIKLEITERRKIRRLTNGEIDYMYNNYPFSDSTLLQWQYNCGRFLGMDSYDSSLLRGLSKENFKARTYPKIPNEIQLKTNRMNRDIQEVLMKHLTLENIAMIFREICQAEITGNMIDNNPGGYYEIVNVVPNPILLSSYFYSIEKFTILAELAPIYEYNEYSNIILANEFGVKYLNISPRNKVQLTEDYMLKVIEANGLKTVSNIGGFFNIWSK